MRDRARLRRSSHCRYRHDRTSRNSIRCTAGRWGTQRLPRLVGSGFAKEMIFSGLPWSPADALRIGLVNRVVAASELISTCEEMARVFIERAGYALKAAKTLINQGVELPLKDALAFE